MYKTNLGIFYNEDCADTLSKMAESETEQHSVDMIFADPPYGQDYELGRSKNRDKVETSIENDKLNQAIILLEKVLPLFNAVSKEDAEWFIFCSGFDKKRTQRIVEKKVEQYVEVKNVIIWDKVHFGFGNDFRYQYETILQCIRGRGLKKASSCGNVIPCKRARVTKNNHPNKKPFGLIHKILSLKQPTFVLDPFVGEGTIPKVCERLGIKWIGCEIKKEWYDYAKKQIDDEKCQDKLFGMVQEDLPMQEKLL